jgi:glycosyltransferase involved in cell wall biosynthesis
VISIATLTYRRENLLEEAIHSFLLQNRHDCEMVVVNDYKNVQYYIDAPNVRIINCEERFSSIGEKLKFCFNNCKHNYMYRLDDDDLLCEGGLDAMCAEITQNPGYDVYRSKYSYYTHNNNYVSSPSNVNNGNCYSKQYVSTVSNWDKSCDEDVFITYRNNANIYEFESKTMIYRWGMGTYHISGIGAGKKHQDYFNVADRLGSNTKNLYKLEPKFKQDYYDKIRKEQK